MIRISGHFELCTILGHCQYYSLNGGTRFFDLFYDRPYFNVRRIPSFLGTHTNILYMRFNHILYGTTRRYHTTFRIIDVTGYTAPKIVGRGMPIFQSFSFVHARYGGNYDKYDGNRGAYSLLFFTAFRMIISYRHFGMFTTGKISEGGSFVTIGILWLDTGAK